MDDDQITSLAREYGEYVANSLDYDMCSGPELRHRLVAKGNFESAQLVLEWLLRRFCLVEKSKATELCRLTLDHGDSVDYGLIDSLTDIVCDIFSEQYQQVAENKSTNPEITKEAEG